jgi:hypothetical protein
MHTSSTHSIESGRASDLSEGFDTPQVFFSYPFKDSEQLKPIFRKACVEAGVLPVFADEIRCGDDIIQKLHQLILSCDMVVCVITRPVSHAVSMEIGYSQAVNKPIFFFVQEPKVLPFHVYGFQFITYETNDELLRFLLSTLLIFKSQLKRPEYVRKKEEQNRIADVLMGSLQKNVLVLGKDSDEEGLAKIERIATVVHNKGYFPVKLKELPEIKYLSLEDKMIRVGGLCRFIIAEDSKPSGHIDEVRLCAECQYITATVREAGTASTWMQAHYPLQYNFMNRFCYRNTQKTGLRDPLCGNVYDSLETATEEAIMWAEKRIKDQTRYFGGDIYARF